MENSNMIKNSQLRESVMDELNGLSSVDTTHVVITADSGTVTLTGHVSAYPDIFTVRQAVGRVQGVRAIADELTLRLPNGHMREDSDIAHDIVLALESQTKHADSDVLAEVSEGFVTLSGTVDWHHERQCLEQQIALIRGVFNISNQIQLRKQVTAEDVKTQIEDALSRHAELEAKHVTVTVKDGEVTLEGHVKAFYERNLVEAAVWLEPGVHKVVDKISVG
jgi:osmotically-inducible protein OsmY